MALRNIIYKGDPLLRKRSREIKGITAHIRELEEDMWDTMYKANGLGLAAPQVGVLRRLVVIDVTDVGEDEEDAGENAEAGPGPESEAEAGPGLESSQGFVAGPEAGHEPEPEQEPEIVKYTLVNPEIVYVSDERVTSKEGCLSVPGMVGVVNRPARVRVRATGMDGKPFEIEGEGMLAKALLHEIDHLEGVLYTDIAESVEEVKPEDEEGEDG